MLNRYFWESSKSQKIVSVSDEIISFLGWYFKKLDLPLMLAEITEPHRKCLIRESHTQVFYLPCIFFFLAEVWNTIFRVYYSKTSWKWRTVHFVCGFVFYKLSASLIIPGPKAQHNGINMTYSGRSGLPGLFSICPKEYRITLTFLTSTNSARIASCMQVSAQSWACSSAALGTTHSAVTNGQRRLCSFLQAPSRDWICSIKTLTGTR